MTKARAVWIYALMALLSKPVETVLIIAILRDDIETILNRD